jgi:hypothetical protein
MSHDERPLTETPELSSRLLEARSRLHTALLEVEDARHVSRGVAGSVEEIERLLSQAALIRAELGLLEAQAQAELIAAHQRSAAAEQG